MSLVERLSEDRQWVSLPDIARELGVHRTAVNSMILDGRLKGERRGPYWRVRRDVFEAFASVYSRPPNVPAPRKDLDTVAPVAKRALGWLVRWDAATTTELREVMTDAPGNIRKATDILRHRGWAMRDESGIWHPTESGRDAAVRLRLPAVDDS
jgi:hypothetical protein